MTMSPSRRAARLLIATLLGLVAVLVPRGGAEAATVPVPPVLVGLDGPTGRIAVFSSTTGRVVRFLTPASTKYIEGLPTLTADRRTVLFIRQSVGNGPLVWGTFSVPLAGGPAKLFRTPPLGGAQPIAAGAGGAFAGSLGEVATVGIEAVNARKHRIAIFGTRDTPDDAIAWAPDGLHLAIGTVATTAPALPAQVHLATTATTHDTTVLGPVVACPSTLKGCGLHGPGYARDGTLWMVATKGTRAYLVRLARGTKVPSVIVTLPRQALTYRVFVAATGAVLVQAETWTNPSSRSAFTAIWNGARLRQLPKTILETAW
jgi:hypothetical protein